MKILLFIGLLIGVLIVAVSLFTINKIGYKNMPSTSQYLWRHILATGFLVLMGSIFLYFINF